MQNLEGITMKKVSLFIVFFILSFANPIYAFDGITFYGTQVTDNDRYNSSGTRLNSVGAILRQDRANYYVYGRNDPPDQGDNYFSSKTNRAIFDSANIEVSPGLAQQIINGKSVLVTVFVISPNEIHVERGLPTPGVD